MRSAILFLAVVTTAQSFGNSFRTDPNTFINETEFYFVPGRLETKIQCGNCRRDEEDADLLDSDTRADNCADHTTDVCGLTSSGRAGRADIRAYKAVSGAMQQVGSVANTASCAIRSAWCPMSGNDCTTEVCQLYVSSCGTACSREE